MSIYPREQRAYAAPNTLDRVVEFGRINIELVAYALLLIVSIIAHLWALDRMAMHHDESIHAWLSWKFFTGVGGFPCPGGWTSPTYCYDPVYHGPSLYVLTLLSYFLFGIGEAQARLPQALAGIGLVATCWTLRPLIGPRGAFLAAILLTFAPSMLYYTRFARHDGLMLLWTLWIVVGFFRFLRDGQTRWLYLLAVGAALAIATHELYYILIFLFGFFLLARVLSELLPARRVTTWLGVIFGVSVVVEILTPILNLPDRYGGIALLLATVSGVSLLMQRVWDTRPIVVERGLMLWREQRTSLWLALGLLVGIYVVLYSTFFANPAGIVDGLYRGLQHWLGTQQEFQRGKQPWYYYLMLLPLYEPLGFFGAISVAVALFFGQRGSREQGAGNRSRHRDDQALNSEASREGDELDETDDVSIDTAVPSSLSPITSHLFPLFLAFWFIGSLIAFSWAGEKMPWLVTHIALPGNLLIAWGISELIGRVRWRDLPRAAVATIPAVIILLIVAIGVMLWRFSPVGRGGLPLQTWLLAGLVPLIFAGGLIFALLTLGQRIGARATFFLSVLTLAGLLGGYMVRASWMVVYQHPDTAREPLIYTQTPPDIPLIVNEIEELAVNQTRNTRSANDPAGGLTMPIIMDVGDTNAEGSLAWPLQWYFRDFKRVEFRNADFFRTATANTFDVQQPGQPEGVNQAAPVVLVSSSHVTAETRQALEENYVKRYDTKLNWWFPEGDLTGCNPEIAGYKQFYYNTLTIERAKADRDCGAIDFNTVQYKGPLAPIGWVLDRAHWADTFRYVMWRELPEPLRLDGREMQVWMRRDIAPNASGETSQATGAAALRLIAEQSLGSAGSADGQLLEPRGVAVDAQGNVYVADTGNHRVVVYGPDGSVARTIGGFGAGDGQFNEPRGVAVDAQGNVYVADTWNARVAKFAPDGTFLSAWGEGDQDFGNGRKATTTDRTEAGNQANELGFFGPRAVAVDARGHVYIADTGNRRIVVTDTDGNYLYQWGYEGSGEGQFNEPIGVAVDTSGNVYVADVWNGRVQMFAPGFDPERVNPVPSATWTVPGWELNSYDDPYLTVGPNNSVYLTVPSRNLAVYTTTSGDTLLRWGGEGVDAAALSLPSGIAIGPDGSVYVTDRGNGRVQRFTLPQVAPPVQQ